MARINTVLFDIGNVFVHWSPRFLYEQLIEDPEELDTFLRDIVTLEWHTEHDRGRPFSEGVRLLSAQYPNHAAFIAAFDERWDDTIKGEIEGTIDLAAALAEKGVPLYALTNFSQEKWPAFASDYAFTRLFEGVVVSGEEGVVKPDPRIFELTIKRFDLTPHATLFVDDRAENIAGAEALGMVGHLFDGPEGLKQKLSDLGLL